MDALGRLHERQRATREFRALADATAPGMLRLASRILGDVGDAEDAVQEAFARVWRAIDAGELTDDRFARTYLYRAVTNAAIDALRRRRRSSVWTRFFGEDPPEVEGNAVAPDVMAALGELGDLLRELPDEQRVALVLKEVEGWTSAEIAAARGCSEGAVEQRLLRARATLRERMRDGGEP